MSDATKPTAPFALGLDRLDEIAATLERTAEAYRQENASRESLASMRDRLAAVEAERDVALARAEAAERALADAFAAGYDAGWGASGEGHNAEWSSVRFTADRYREARNDALAAWLDERPVQPGGEP